MKTTTIYFENFIKLEEVLPSICSPWYSMGDADTLARIGKILDNYPKGSEEPKWDLAAEVTAVHHEYTKPGGAYSKEYSLSPSGYYAPGEIAVAPTYEGEYDKWGLHVVLTATAGRKITVMVGRTNRQPLVTIDFGPRGSYLSASEVAENLERLAVRFESTEIPDEEL